MSTKMFGWITGLSVLFSVLLVVLVWFWVRDAVMYEPSFIRKENAIFFLASFSFFEVLFLLLGYLWKRSRIDQVLGW